MVHPEVESRIRERAATLHKTFSEEYAPVAGPGDVDFIVIYKAAMFQAEEDVADTTGVPHSKLEMPDGYLYVLDCKKNLYAWSDVVMRAARLTAELLGCAPEAAEERWEALEDRYAEHIMRQINKSDH